jgi:hypothetical protein
MIFLKELILTLPTPMSLEMQKEKNKKKKKLHEEWSSLIYEIKEKLKKQT